MKRWGINIAVVISLILWSATLLVQVLEIDKAWMVQDGGGGIGGGSNVATVVIILHRTSVGIGWTHSDIFFEHMLSIPLWILMTLSGVPPVWWVWQKTRRKTHGFPVTVNAPTAEQEIKAK